MATCAICGTTSDDEFTAFHNPHFCDRCYDILDYWWKETWQDLKTQTKAWKGEEPDFKDVYDALEWFLVMKGEEYDNRKNGQKR